MEALEGYASGTNGSAARTDDPPEPQTLPPLTVTGMVVNKTDLLAALRTWVPQIRDVSPLGEDRFVLDVGPTHQNEQGR